MQAGDLTSATRPAEGASPEIKDTYLSNGDGLRVAQKTTFLTWDLAERLPLMINDGTRSYLYGPAGIPFEQITGDGKATYLHHDQQHSTRLITNPTGTTEGAYTYDPYGRQTNHTGTATTPFGYDSQYTNSSTGLIYLRARNYDPITTQFTSADPMLPFTGAPYTYAGDNPLNIGDPSGLCNANPFSESFWTKGNCISESPLNPIRYYEKEIESYENGCGYYTSVTYGLEGAVSGAALVAGGEGEDEAASVADEAAPSAAKLFNDLAEALPDHYVYIGTSVVFTTAGIGFLAYEGGKLIYEAVK